MEDTSLVNSSRLQVQSIREEGGHHVAHRPLVSPHESIWFLLTMLGMLLQVKDSSPFDTNYVTMIMFIVDLFVYIAAFAATKTLILQAAASDEHLFELMNDISLLFGTLALVFLLLILVPNLGWFTLGCWMIYVVIIAAKSYSCFKRLCGTIAAQGLHKLNHLRIRFKSLIMSKEESQNHNGLP